MSVTDTFTASGTWTCPSGVTSVDVSCWAGGGGGGKASSGKISNPGGGGGGGAFSGKSGLSVTPGNSYTVTVGDGGVGSTGANATNGEDSWFSTSGTILAKGGIKGSDGGQTDGNGSGGQSSAGVGDTKYSGGNGVAGQGGGGAGTTANGANPTGGSVGGGNGGAIGTTGNNGSAGNVKGGGGGGGGLGTTTGGKGARGEVQITYTAVASQNSNFFQFF